MSSDYGPDTCLAIEDGHGARTRVRPTVGVIGLGDIGSGVAAGLVRAGIDLVVCDIRPESTAPFADTARMATDPAELGALVDVVVVAVVNDDQVLAVLDGADRGDGRCPTGLDDPDPLALWPPARWPGWRNWPAPAMSTWSIAGSAAVPRRQPKELWSPWSAGTMPSWRASDPFSTPSARWSSVWVRSGRGSTPSWPATSSSTAPGWPPTRPRSWPRRPASIWPSWPR